MTGRTIIVGAGPAGLAVAAMLGQRGITYTLLERADSIGAAWRNRYDGLRLHTVRRLSGLPGAPIPRRFGRWISRDDLVEYLEDYARRFQVEPELGVEVTRVERTDGGWRVETSDGARVAERVVLATGYTRTPHVPDWPGLDSFSGSFRHSVDYREPSAYTDRKVLVVGSGNSASEIAVEISQVAAEVQLSVRTPPNIVRRATLGVPSQVIAVALRRAPESLMNRLSSLLRRLTVPDLSGYGLPAPGRDGFSQYRRSKVIPILDHGFVDAVRAGRITIVSAVQSFDGDEVRLDDGRTVRPDAIVAATGYRPDLEGILGDLGDLGVLDDDGAPRVQGARTVNGAPGLYFVGISVELSGQLLQIAREVEELSKSLASA